MPKIKSPVVYFGNKHKIAARVWEILGNDVKCYIEPFCGSLSVLLTRPDGWTGVERVGDFNCFLINFWRAIQNDPIGVAKLCVGPSATYERMSRELYLLQKKDDLQKALGDPHYYDVEAAAFYIKGNSEFIGSGYLEGRGGWSWNKKDGWFQVKSKKTCEETSQVNRNNSAGVDTTSTVNGGMVSYGGKNTKGVNTEHTGFVKSSMGNNTMVGIHSGVELGTVSSKLNIGPTQGVLIETEQTKELGTVSSKLNIGPTQGVLIETEQTKELGTVSSKLNTHRLQTVNTENSEKEPLGEYELKLNQLARWFMAIRDRICKLYINCGDWKRICKSDSMRAPFPCGIFLDPPYKGTEYVYSDKSTGVYKEVQDFCIEMTKDTRIRIVLAGRGDEHDELLKHGWTKELWSAGNGYARGENAEERHNEALWISPSCPKKEEVKEESTKQGKLL